MIKYNGYWLARWDKFTPYPSSYLYKHGRYKKAYCRNFICLDTETSKKLDMAGDPLFGWVYQWAFSYGKVIVYGRTPSQLCAALQKVIDVNYEAYTTRRNSSRHQYAGTGDEYRLLCFVHNLPYDWEYLRKFFSLQFGEHELMADRPHKVFRVDYPREHIEFRCTYKLSNKSLDKWTTDLGTKNKKLAGTVDYEKIRYQDEKLTATDWRYQFNDVIVMDEAMRKQLDLYGDDLLSLPLTSTKYTRRQIEEKFLADTTGKYQRDFATTRLTPELYEIARKAAVGGITHGNFFHYGETIEGNIGHRDFRSHYPTQQIIRGFPIGRPVKYFDLEDGYIYKGTLKKFLPNNKKCYLLQIIIKDLKLKSNTITMPYISKSKLYSMNENGFHGVYDNGRVMEVSGYYMYYCCDVDLYWLLRQYDYESITLYKVYECDKGKLPAYMTDVIRESFKGKTEFKIILHEMEQLYGTDSDEAFEAALSLMKSKNSLNGIFGVSYTDPIRETIELIGDEWSTSKSEQADEIAEALAKYYKRKTTCMSYLWGLYTTAYARDELMSCIEIIGYENFLYCDTDSIFYRSTPEIEKRLNDLNETWRAEALESGWFEEVRGEKINFHAFEREPAINKFRYLHAKCYAMHEYDKKRGDYRLKCTIAGVRQRATYWENGEPVKITREEELGNIENLKTGFVFRKTGSSACVYLEHEIDTITIDGHKTELANAAVIVPSESTLSTTEIDLDWLKIELDE